MRLESPPIRALLPEGSSTPEWELLLRCARSTLNDGVAEEIRALAGPDLNWKRFGRLAQEHQVTSLAFRTLARVCPEQLPAPVHAALQLRYHANAAHYLQLTHRLGQVVELLADHGIEALVLKGPALAAQLYPEPSVREFKDLDLLVRREDALRVRDLLGSQGYAIHPLLTERQMQLFLRSECEFWFACPGDEVPLEIHWDLREPVYAYPLTPDECWRDAGTCRAAGQEIRVLSREHTALTLSCHGAKHRWGQLKHVCDLAELVRAWPDLDWERAAARADRLHGRRMLLLGLRLAERLLGAEIPEALRREVAVDPALEPLVTDVTHYLLDSRRPSRLSPAGTRLYLRMRERWQERLRYTAGTLLTPTLEDWGACPLPEPLFPVYYLYRPLRLLSRTLRARKPLVT